MVFLNSSRFFEGYEFRPRSGIGFLGGRGCHRTNRIVLQHAQRPMLTRPLDGPEVARHGHGYEAHHNGTGLGYSVLVSTVHLNGPLLPGCQNSVGPQVTANPGFKALKKELTLFRRHCESQKGVVRLVSRCLRSTSEVLRMCSRSGFSSAVGVGQSE
jgi:hypothetical protein